MNFQFNINVALAYNYWLHAMHNICQNGRIGETN